MAHVRDIQIATMKDLIYISSMKDDVENGQMVFRREGALRCWARIDDWRPSYIAPTGYTVENPEHKKTHEIYIRYRTDFIFTTGAWIYNERLKSAPRWFKILGSNDVDEAGRFTCFWCELMQHSDSANQPQPPKAEVLAVKPLPSGVRL
jgi:head-tail adaptor